MVSSNNVLFVYQFCPSDYKEGFGGKFGVQTDRQDKSAVGWDHIEKVNKHESQKGEQCPCIVCLTQFCPTYQITKLALEGNLEFRMTGLISLLSVGSTMKKAINMNLRKVSRISVCVCSHCFTFTVRLQNWLWW